nr:hypothetical protein [uncultured Mucilaginibacter sp.]
MNFFKKLFSAEKPAAAEEGKTDFAGVYSDQCFNDRYTESDIEEHAEMIEGSLKMIESYFLDNKLEREIYQPINHPQNLDQVVTEGMGFLTYCKAFELPDGQIAWFLAMAFIEFLQKNFGFKIYMDNKPEFPLRTMTLKYDKNGVILSLYPLEYAVKVLQNESTFLGLYSRLEGHLERMPGTDELLKKYLGIDRSGQ